MTTVTRALVINVGVMQANNNTRRSIGAFALNFPSANNTISNVVMDLAPGTSVTFNPTNLSTALTMLRCSSPVSIQYTLNAVGTVRPNPVVVNSLVTSFFMIDDSVGNVIVSNAGLSATSTINFVQG